MSKRPISKETEHRYARRDLNRAKRKHPKSTPIASRVKIVKSLLRHLAKATDPARIAALKKRIADNLMAITIIDKDGGKYIDEHHLELNRKRREKLKAK